MRRNGREAQTIRVTILVLTSLLALATVTLAAPAASATDACTGTPGSDCSFIVCVGAHRDDSGRVAYCDTTVFWPPTSV